MMHRPDYRITGLRELDRIFRGPRVIARLPTFRTKLLPLPDVIYSLRCRHKTLLHTKMAAAAPVAPSEMAGAHPHIRFGVRRRQWRTLYRPRRLLSRSFFDSNFSLLPLNRRL